LYGSAHRSAPLAAVVPEDSVGTAPAAVADSSRPVGENTKSSEKSSVFEKAIATRALTKLGDKGDAVGDAVTLGGGVDEGVSCGVDEPDGVTGGVAPGLMEAVDAGVPVGETDDVAEALGVLDGVCDGVDVCVGVGVGVGFRHSVPGCCVFNAQFTFILKPNEQAGDSVTVV